MKELDVVNTLLYDTTSPSCLRWAIDVRNGKVGTGRLLVRAGDAAGTLDSRSGYYRISLSRNRKQAHRVVWELFYGPTEHEIDHINGVRTDNRIENLRAVGAGINRRNQNKRTDNTSGENGVTACRNKDNLVVNFRAEWQSPDNKRGSKTFSVSKYGNEEAFHLACEYRTKMIEELNAQGAGYTEDHGKRVAA